jgi:hypothetical protein
VLDPRLPQPIAIEADAGDRLPTEVARQPAEGLRALVDDGHGVAAFDEVAAQGGADPSATHDDDVHWSLSLGGLDGSLAGTVRWLPPPGSGAAGAAS